MFCEQIESMLTAGASKQHRTKIDFGDVNLKGKKSTLHQSILWHYDTLILTVFTAVTYKTTTVRARFLALMKYDSSSQTKNATSCSKESVIITGDSNPKMLLPIAVSKQRELVRGSSCRFFNAIDMKPAVASFRRCWGAPQNPNVNYINFEPLYNL